MPKIRALKPDFWTDEAVVSVQPLARLLFQGLWNYSCDNGHVQDKPKQIKMRVLPADDCDVDAMLNELADADLITRADGTITVDTLGDHNRIDKRFFTTCELDGCTNPFRDAPQSPPRVPAENPQSAPGSHDDDVDGDVDSDGDVEQKSGPRKRGTRLPDGWIPAPELRQQMATERPDVDLKAEHLKFCDHWKAQPGQKGVKADWDATWRNWIRNARGEPKPRPSNGIDFEAAMARAQARDAQRGLTA